MGEKMTLREVLDGVLVHVDGIAPYAEVPVVDLQAWADTLTAHLTQPAQAVDVGAIREVVSAMQTLDPRFKSFGHDRWVDKLTAALPKDSNQEKP